uniref:Uncharacterized protein n=1 Tax=Anguilla anguilla TaxID=7936 RepID=A0A0E9XJ90_ANGAN
MIHAFSRGNGAYYGSIFVLNMDLDGSVKHKSILILGLPFCGKVLEHRKKILM